MRVPDPQELLFRVAKGVRNYRRPWRLVFDRLLRRPMVQVTDRATGLSFRCLREADRMFGETFHSRVYDVPTVPVGPGSVVIDVGANHGFAACHFARMGARVLALEPHPEVFQALDRNVRVNRLEDRVQTVQMAVSDHAGTATFLATRRLGGGMSSLDEGYMTATETPIDQRYEVPVTTLPRVVEELGAESVRLVKLDCEGSELRILRSLGPDLLARIDSFAIEYHPAAYPLSELIELLLGWGTFSVSKAVTPGTANANLHVVSHEALARWAAGG